MGVQSQSQIAAAASEFSISFSIFDCDFDIIYLVSRFDIHFASTIISYSVRWFVKYSFIVEFRLCFVFHQFRTDLNDIIVSVVVYV